MSDLDPRFVLNTLGYPDIDTVRPVSGGRDTAIFRVERGTDTYALRVFRPEQLQVSRSEMQSMQAAAAGGVPVPQVFADGIHDGRPALLLEWCAGQTIAAALQRWPERAGELGQACGDVLARIHAVRITVDQQGDGWLRWGGLCPGDPLYDRMVAFGRPDQLLHLDFHPLNILTDGERVTAVLDWANAGAGDGRADFARSIAILRLDTGQPPADVRSLLRGFERGLRTGYVAATGPLATMPLFHIWAGHSMLHDLAPRLASNPAQASRIGRWVQLWERRSTRM